MEFSWSWLWGLLLGMAGGVAAHWAGPLDPARLLQKPARMRRRLILGSVARLLVSLATLGLAFLLFRRSAGAIMAALMGLLLIRAVSVMFLVRAQRGRGR
ncbi:MAG: hypothetical protein K6T75_01535 [Acetobacteraceae bacterium]|nr:hypothetical protein [Acetobacteraceae bacterium]